MLDYPEALKDLYRADGTPKNLTLTFPDVTITNTNIETETAIIEESLSSDTDLEFGACEASMFEITVFGIDSDKITAGKTFTVEQTLGEYTKPLGEYTVDSCTRVDEFGRRKIVAYDAIKKSDVDVSTWYNTLNFTGLTVKSMRESLLTHLGIAYTAQNLTNDSVLISKTVNPSYLLGRDVLRAICQLNAGFGHIGRDGNFRVVQMAAFGLFPSETLYPEETLYPADSSETFEADAPDGISTTREEYIVSAITGVWIRQDSGDIGTSVGTNTNPYIVENNFLCYGKTSTQMAAIASAILAQIGNKTYIPARTTCNGRPWLEVGDTYVNNKGSVPIESYIMQRRMTGIQALKDEYVSTGNEKRSAVVSQNTQMKQIEGKTARLEQTVNGLTSTVTDLASETESAIEQLSDSISLKVSQGEVSSEISLESGQVALRGNRLVVESTNFQLDGNGNATFSGTVSGGTLTNTDATEGALTIESGSIKQVTAPTSSMFEVEIAHGYIMTDSNSAGNGTWYGGTIQLRKGSAYTYISPTGAQINNSPVLTAADQYSLHVAYAADANTANRASTAARADVADSVYRSTYTDNIGTSSAYCYVGSNTGGFVPDSNGSVPCGSAYHKWSEVYASTGTINTSDARNKQNIVNLEDRHFEFLKMIQPRSFEYIDGTSGRTHIGFVAQEIETAMMACGLTDLDFAGFVKSPIYSRYKKDGETPYSNAKIIDYIYGLRYSEFIALITYGWQRTEQKLDNLIAVLTEKGVLDE